MATLPVSVNISRNTTAVKRASFGYPLFVTATVPVVFTERVRIYDSLEGLSDDGFDIADTAYEAALAHFSQNPAPSKFYVGRKDGADASLSATLDAISAENDDWYFILYEADTQADVLAIAAWTEAKTKMYFAEDNTTGSLAAFDAGNHSDLLGTLFDSNYDRTVGVYHDTAIVAPTSILAANAVYDAGSVTWNYLQPNGLSASKNGTALLNTTETNNLKQRNANYVGLIAGTTATIGGRVVSGEPISVIRGIDSLTEDLSKSLTDVLLNQKGAKLSFSDKDIEKLGAVMRQVLSIYVAREFIFDDFEVVLPSAASIPNADKVAGILNGITFKARLQGSIDEIVISGNITY